MNKVFVRIIGILLILCIIVTFAMSAIGCGSAKIDVTDLHDDILDYINSDASQTSTVLSATSDPSKKNALIQYMKSMKVESIEYAEDQKTKSYSFKCRVVIPDVESISSSLCNSQAFKTEFASKSDGIEKSNCIYQYVANTVLADVDISKTSSDVLSTGSDLNTAITTFKTQIDSKYKQALSTFALTNFYKDEDASGEVMEKVPFVEATDLSDFVFKIDKNKIAVSNIKIVANDAALEQLVALSKNNSYISISPSNSIYYIEYEMTNLSKDPITVKNYFSLGSVDGKMYTNYGFYPEGLSTNTELKQGKSTTFTTVLVGDVSSNLYFYNESMCGARHWTGVPVS